MTRETNEMDQAVSRTLRDSLERLQRTAEELHQAVNDLVSACASTKPANALPPMLRAQTSAASLGASLEVLSRFVTSSLRPAAPTLPEPVWAAPEAAQERAIETAPERVPELTIEPRPVQAVAEETVMAEAEPIVAPVEVTPAVAMDTISERTWEPFTPGPLETVASFGASDIVDTSAPTSMESEAESVPGEAFGDAAGLGGFSEMPGETSSMPVEAFPDLAAGFDLANLPAEEQELHRRANRVAKVSMQDIKLLRPNDVRLGQENRDLCFRLREDLERAYKEYERRFQTIQNHPVDYFYDWAVEILANGDPHLLGEYPYPSAVLRH